MDKHLAKLKILIVVAELSPFSNVGGLARGTRSLAKSLSNFGHDVRIITPFHGCAIDYLQKNQMSSTTKEIDTILLKSDLLKTKTSFSISLREYTVETETHRTYFVDYPDFFSLRSNVYGYDDDDQRFYLFSQACLEWLLRLKEQSWVPDIIQCHDWHTGYFVDLLKNNDIYQTLKKIPILYTVHNFKYQHQSKFQFMDEVDVDMAESPLGSINSTILKKQNGLIRGMIFADYVNTVSPTHSREIQTPEYAYNLNKVIIKVRNKLSGILNGLDYNEFQPSQDVEIKYHFDQSNFIAQRRKNKKYLRNLFSLPDVNDAPLFTYVGRMTSQKGLELLFEVMSKIMTKYPTYQLVGLGDGEDHYCELFWELKKRYPLQVRVKLTHDKDLPRQIFAASDITLVPSNFEPGGIVALESLRYGSIPIVRRTGGLNDIITDFRIRDLTGNGFSFLHKNKREFQSIIEQAVSIYQNDREVWNHLTTNCLLYRRTWDDAAKEYENLFSKIISLRSNL